MVPLLMPSSRASSEMVMGRPPDSSTSRSRAARSTAGTNRGRGPFFDSTVKTLLVCRQRQGAALFRLAASGGGSDAQRQAWRSVVHAYRSRHADVVGLRSADAWRAHAASNTHVRTAAQVE